VGNVGFEEYRAVFLLLAAHFIIQRGVPPLFRIHDCDIGIAGIARKVQFFFSIS